MSKKPINSFDHKKMGEPPVFKMDNDTLKQTFPNDRTAIIGKPDFKGFADDILEMLWEGYSDLFGGDVQESAAKHGIIKEYTATKSCGVGCSCAEFGFPQKCFRKAY